MKPKGSAIPTHFPSNCQNLTSHSLPPAGWNAPLIGSVCAFAALNLPQYATPLDATSEMGIP